MILTNDRGTSSLQLSDSEEEKLPRPSLVHTHSTRRSNKNQNQNNSPGPAVNADQTADMDQGANSKLGATNDTDSVNENFSPVRPSTKRKRKFKRMALDPDNNRCLTNKYTVIVLLFQKFQAATIAFLLSFSIHGSGFHNFYKRG